MHKNDNLSICLFMKLSIYATVSIYLSMYASIYPVYLYIYANLCPSMQISIYRSIHPLFVYLFMQLCVCLSRHLSVCLLTPSNFSPPSSSRSRLCHLLRHPAAASRHGAVAAAEPRRALVLGRGRRQLQARHWPELRAGGGARQQLHPLG